MNECRDSLPSARAVQDFLEQGPPALPPVGTTLGRACLIGLGLYAAGERKRLVKKSLYGALAVEGFLIGWFLMERKS
jgi:hypothetical protein